MSAARSAAAACARVHSSATWQSVRAWVCAAGVLPGPPWRCHRWRGALWRGALWRGALWRGALWRGLWRGAHSSSSIEPDLSASRIENRRLDLRSFSVSSSRSSSRFLRLALSSAVRVVDFRAFGSAGAETSTFRSSNCEMYDIFCSISVSAHTRRAEQRLGGAAWGSGGGSMARGSSGADRGGARPHPAAASASAAAARNILGKACARAACARAC
jgi:hypothetical protein